MLYTLEKAGLLALLSRQPHSIGMLRKPDKIYMGNSNLMSALTTNPNIGTIRETFFYNQLNSAGHEVTLSAKGDFIVDNQYTFEVIRNIENSFLAVDNTSIGDVHRIPLWLFGFLY